ncbi:MAG: protein-glutamate O-methyltransferase CheR [Pseudomonadota bacterium]
MSVKPQRQPQVALPVSLTDDEMAQFQKLAKSAAGIDITESKRTMIYTRFVRRLRSLGLSTFPEYLKLAADTQGSEYQNFINTVTTNLTYFFREPHHFEFLANTAIPDLYDTQRRTAPLRFWSTGCSSGEEPYSIAMVLAAAGKKGGKDYRLLCTDIDTQMVAATQQGVFAESRLRGLEAEHLRQWFTKDPQGQYVANDALREGMMCRQLNLFEKIPLRTGIDVIFCRNVLIYFVKTHQREIVTKFAKHQEPGQYLFLGHSESLRDFDDYYERVSNTVYRRI